MPPVTSLVRWGEERNADENDDNPGDETEPFERRHVVELLKVDAARHDRKK
eukprot:CAMPEP_0182545838 /NCGR_PEP_ID=MMETSP1323-20130603/35115_1 /TAXON_ID=236787 /ORGANISM="Florenciella parvula, Strain RCC1693" /LENGTH=50 /DNA_ID=CAMNT_0024757013 /DNA_START=102 /DNA_END=251 /DNA_ORIENTATION=+